MPSLKDRIDSLLFSSVDNSPLILFRMLFGLLLALEGFGAIMTGWVKRAFIAVDYTFPFIAFDFLQPWPGYGMYIHFIFLGIFGLMIMLGYYYRLAIVGYFLLWSFAYFLQKVNYNNHYYLMVLLTFVMIFLPANRAYSLDAQRGNVDSTHTMPSWIVWFFIFQNFIFYSYASVAKWNADWFSFQSVGMLFSNKADYPIIGGLLQEKWLQFIIAFGGVVFDLLIVPALLWSKTRKWALGTALVFHVFNSIVFQIGIFPYMALALYVFFFSGEYLRKTFLRDTEPCEQESIISYGHKKVVMVFMAVWFTVQLLLPLRHHLIEGDVNWTEEGHRMSWRMMLRTKQGYVRFKVVDKKTKEVKMIRPEHMLTQKQASLVATRPDFCWQYVQLLKREYAEHEIYALGRVSLNGGAYGTLFKENKDLASVEWIPFAHADWITAFPPERD